MRLGMLIAHRLGVVSAFLAIAISTYDCGRCEASNSRDRGRFARLRSFQTAERRPIGQVELVDELLIIGWCGREIMWIDGRGLAADGADEFACRVALAVVMRIRSNHWT